MSTAELLIGKESQLVSAILDLLRPMNKKELCDFLKIESHTLEYYNAHGLPRTKMGNEVRYLLSDVLNYFRNKGIKPAKERFEDASEVEG